MERLKINSSCDNLPLDVIISTCADPKGIVQIAHGMCEYKRSEERRVGKECR